MAEGRFTGAYHYYQEIERALPGFRDVPELLAKANYARKEQRYLLMGSITGAMILIVLARLLGNNNELVFLILAIFGLALGFLLVAGMYRWLGRGPD